MPDKTDNHEYNKPKRGETNWDVPLNANFDSFDVDVELRGPENERSNYDPKAGTKFLATDTGRVYVGDGSSWNHVAATGPRPTLEMLRPDGDFLGVGRSTPVSGSEVFGIDASNSGNMYGGMYLDGRANDGKPFYGYSIDGGMRAWHHFDENDGEWKLVVDSQTRLAADEKGNVRVPGHLQVDYSGSFGAFQVDSEDAMAGRFITQATGTGSSALTARHEGSSGGTFYGIQGEVEADTNGSAGVTGKSSANSGSGFGVIGWSDGDRGTGVLGFGLNRNSSDAVGLRGRTEGGGWGIVSDDGAKIHGDLEVTGNKHFAQAVETADGEKEVVYTAVEADRAHTETSGVVELRNGRAAVEMPEHFRLVTSEDEPLMVQVTAHASEPTTTQVTERSPDRILIEEVGDGPDSYEVSYTVRGIRAGQEDAEPMRDPTDDLPDPLRPDDET